MNRMTLVLAGLSLFAVVASCSGDEQGSGAPPASEDVADRDGSLAPVDGASGGTADGGVIDVASDAGTGGGVVDTEDGAIRAPDATGGLAGPGSVALFAPAAPAGDPLTERMVATAAATLEAATGVAPTVHRPQAPATLEEVTALAAGGGAGAVLVLDAATLLPEAVGATEVAALPWDGFRLRVIEAGDHANGLDGAPGATVVLCAGSTKLARQYALYEALRRLGVRYYHPEQELIPRVPAAQVRPRLRTPTAVARRGPDGAALEDYTPDFQRRAYTFHGAHPLEHLEAFSDAGWPIDEAVRVNDWIVKNRGDQLRGAGRGVASPEALEQRAAELADLGALLGLRRSTGITLHNQQQGASASIDPTSPVPVKEQIETLVTERLAANPDAIHFGVHFGPTELTVTPDEETVQWIDWAGNKARELRPDLPVLINDHITGSQPTPHYDDLGCPPGTHADGLGDYYDLAFHTAPELGVSVHTVMFYPLEGAAPVYNQQSFAHKLCLMEKASAVGRPLTWFPEGSWWLSFDNPIPVYLPLYIAARGRDIELLRPLLASRGGGTLVGHRMFDSGHEWGYWQQDYAVGLWHWNADVSVADVVGELMDPLCAPGSWPGGCAARDEGVSVLTEAMDFQWDTLLTRKDWRGLEGGLITYLAGEDPADEMGALAGLTFRPVRVSFSKVATWSDAQVAAFQAGDLAALSEMETAYAGWVERLRVVESTVPAEGLPWLHEVIDGLEIDGLRARHVRLLYEAAIAHGAAQRDGEHTQEHRARIGAARAEALTTLAAAEEVIRRREAAYRYPAPQEWGGGDTVETAVPNGTTYPWRVHFKTHALSYWHNRQDQLELLVQGGGGDEVLRLEPAFAKPGVPLTMAWPPGLVGTVDLGDGAQVGPETTAHAYEGAGAWTIGGSVVAGEAAIPIAGAVARADALASTPKGGLTLIAPSSAVAQTVIASLAPGFRWALLPATPAAAGVLALAPDLGGVDFRRVTLATLPPGASQTEPFTLVVPVPDPSTGEVSLQLTVKEAVLTVPEGGLTGVIGVTGGLVVHDLVDALVALAGYDEAGALQTLGDILGFDPADQPETVPFEASFVVK